MKTGLTILIAALVLFSGCASQEETPAATTVVPTTLETIAPETAAETTVKETGNLKPGETAKISNLKVEVESFRKTDSMLYYNTRSNQNYRLKAPADMTYLIVDARVRNLEQAGKFSPTLDISRFRLVDSNLKSYSPEDFEGADLMPLSKTLNSGNEMEGRVVFKILKDAEGLVLVYDFSGIEEGAGEARWDLE